MNEPKENDEEKGYTLLDVGTLVPILWYGIFLWIAIDQIQGVWEGAKANSVKVALGLVLLLIFFMIVHVATRAALNMSSAFEEPPPTPLVETGFPAGSTGPVALWLLIFAITSIAGVLFGLWLHGKPESDSFEWVNTGMGIHVVEALISMTAAGVGSCVTTILGYLSHASVKKDFDSAYVPWYVARPLMGVLLGLVFYFVVRGGLVLLMAPGGEGEMQENLDPWGIAALGALVGLFSKNAIEKLREIFDTLFRTEADLRNDILNKLPDDLKKQVKEHI